MRVGVLALQGDFQKHCDAVNACGAEPVEVRMPGDLAMCDRLIIPGGESTTLAILIRRHGLDEAIRQSAQQGMPIWGTCMGMILMAKRIEGRDQWSLGLLDVTILRNAFGSQVHSFEEPILVAGLDSPMNAVFIRAPAVVETGGGVAVLASVRGKVVAVREGALLGTSFHPELTPDLRLHKMFLSNQFGNR
jgi:5'-phosphate synthase pdxT subunit